VYDTLAVDHGVLRIYPDVYDRGTTRVARIRRKLTAVGVNTGGLPDRTFEDIIRKSRGKHCYTINVAHLVAALDMLAVEKDRSSEQKSN
jgi:hypothetical protein